jgi:polyphenol oxidase
MCGWFSRVAMQLLWPCLSATAACLALLLSVIGTIEGAPILGPDLNTCTPLLPLGYTGSVSCCFEECRAIVDFEYPDPADQPMRIRQGIHKVDDEFWAKYERALAIMKELPDHDPRSWHAQSNIHCIYGAGAAYQQFNSSPPKIFEVHFSWFTLPFHRMMIYFHERILGSLIGDPSFAVPYWAWDIQNETNPLANGILDVYSNRSSPFFDEHRAQNHIPPNPVDLNFPVRIFVPSQNGNPLLFGPGPLYM